MNYLKPRKHYSCRLNVIPIADCACVDTLCLSDVTAENREQMQGSQAVISCKVTGLTKVLDEVKWTKSDNSEITSDDFDGFVTDTGSFSGDTQITTLTVPASQTDVDKTYNCVITSDEHGVTEKITAVNLKVFSKLSSNDIR